jgi:hypothetical protein
MITLPVEVLIDYYREDEWPNSCEVCRAPRGPDTQSLVFCEWGGEPDSLVMAICPRCLTLRGPEVLAAIQRGLVRIGRISPPPGGGGAKQGPVTKSPRKAAMNGGAPPGKGNPIKARRQAQKALQQDQPGRGRK